MCCGYLDIGSPFSSNAIFTHFVEFLRCSFQIPVMRVQRSENASSFSMDKTLKERS